MGLPPDQIMDLYERHADQYITDRAWTRYNESIWLNRFAAALRIKEYLGMLSEVGISLRIRS
jgi:hypothetical protein